MLLDFSTENKTKQMFVVNIIFIIIHCCLSSVMLFILTILIDITNKFPCMTKFKIAKETNQIPVPVSSCFKIIKHKAAENTVFGDVFFFYIE